MLQVAQQPVGQAVGQGAQLLFGVLDDGAERCVAGHHLRPAQPVEGQRHRVFGGEPADGARQIDVGREVFVAAVAFDVDADRRAGVAHELGARQRVRDQQNVLHPSVKRCGHFAEQQAGGLGLQRCRQVSGAGIGVDYGLHRRQRCRGR